MKHIITVSEPWDFVGATGNNTVTGKVIKIISPVTAIFKSDVVLNFDDNTGNILILKPRYEKETFVNEMDLHLTVGVGLYLLDSYEGKDEKFLESNSKYILIGSLKTARF